MSDNDAVDQMMKGVISLCTPLQDVVLREAVTDREYANSAAAELLALRAELTDKDKQITDWRDTYDITMPCGHKNRYLLPNERCLMCEMDSMKGSA